MIASEYGMFSEEGNKEIKKLVEKAIELPLKTSNVELYKFLNEGMRQICQKGHAEAHDTDVRERMIFELEKHTNKNLTIYF